MVQEDATHLEDRQRMMVDVEMIGGDDEFGVGPVDVGAVVGDDAIGGMAIAPAEESFEQQRAAGRHADDGVIANRLGAWAIRDELEGWGVGVEQIDAVRDGMFAHRCRQLGILLEQVACRRHESKR